MSLRLRYPTGEEVVIVPSRHRPTPPASRLATLAPLVTALVLAAGASLPLQAQVPPQEGPLPAEVQAHALELANRPGTLRLAGAARIPAGSRVEGDVVILGGSLRMGGHVTGELLVANGDLFLEPGARVDGALHVIGGRVEGAPDAVLAQPPQVFRAPLRYRIRGDVVEGVGDPDELAARFLSADLGFGRTRFTLRAGGPYNRVEGLPVEFGPLVETAGRNPLVVRAFGIWRSAGGLDLDTDRMGYLLGLEQAVGGRGNVAVGGELYSRIRPIEEGGMSNLENSLASFLMTRDYRDYVEVEGWRAFVDATPIRLPFRVRAGFREESYAFAPVRNPWALGRDDDPWRPQPVPALGTARYVEGELEWDTRNDPEHPTDGWWLEARALRQVGGTLRDSVPGFGPSNGLPYSRVTWASVDLRRYARVSPSSHLQARLFVSGSPTGHALPAQFQSSLGGEGSLPGHPRFAVDCDARSPTVAAPDEDDFTGAALLGYGCNGASLIQLEFQRLLPVVWDPVPEAWDGSELAGLAQIQPAVSVFLNAGQGWARSRTGFPLREDSPRRADLGVGLVTGRLGLYWAYPINRRDRRLNFFVRLEHRF